MSNLESFLEDLPIWGDDEAKQILTRICEQYNVPVDVITELVALQRSRQHQERARNIYLSIEEIIGRMD